MGSREGGWGGFEARVFNRNRAESSHPLAKEFISWKATIRTNMHFWRETVQPIVNRSIGALDRDMGQQDSNYNMQSLRQTAVINPSIRGGSLYDRFQGYLPGFVPRDSIPRDTLGIGHTTPITTSVRKTQKNIASLWWRVVLMYFFACFHMRSVRVHPQAHTIRVSLEYCSSCNYYNKVFFLFVYWYNFVSIGVL